MEQVAPQTEFKPNIYPIMYWAILYGVMAAIALLLFKLLADYLTFLWFPVFLGGMVWGGYRKYKQDKKSWMTGKGIVGTSKSAVEEFKDAARDIAQASQEMVSRHAQEDAEAVIAQQETPAVQPEMPIETQTETEVAPIPEVVPEAEIPAESEEIVTQEPEEPEDPRNPQSPTQPLV